jgi:hypothetical protein
MENYMIIRDNSLMNTEGIYTHHTILQALLRNVEEFAGPRLD